MNKHLNEKTEHTEKVIHLAVTTLCDRKCPYCCNNWYSWNEVEQVSHEELLNAHNICITGGEPFAYSNPCAIAKKLRNQYKNIKKVYVYTNACELLNYLIDGGLIYDIDGLNISVKNINDKRALEVIEKTELFFKKCNLTDNIIYSFSHLVDTSKWKTIDRVWQKEFIPADDSIFRRI